MRTRKEYKLEKNRVNIREKKPVVQFNYSALLEIEKALVVCLYHLGLASNYDVNRYIEKNKVKTSYTTVRKTLEDLFVLGWVGKRKVGSRTLYYLTEETKNKLKEQIDDSTLLISVRGD